jgi:hypothetical protein
MARPNHLLKPESYGIVVAIVPENELFNDEKSETYVFMWFVDKESRDDYFNKDYIKNISDGLQQSKVREIVKCEKFGDKFEVECNETCTEGKCMAHKISQVGVSTSDRVAHINVNKFHNDNDTKVMSKSKKKRLRKQRASSAH